MYYLTVSKTAYYISLDKTDTCNRARRIGSRNVYTCLSVKQIESIIDLFLDSIRTEMVYCSLPLVYNCPTAFPENSKYLYTDRKRHWCWRFDKIACTATLTYDAEIFCRYPNHTCFDSFNNEIQMALDDYGTAMFYDFQERVLYYVDENEDWYKIPEANRIHLKPEKLSRKPKLSDPDYIIDRHFLKPKTVK